MSEDDITFPAHPQIRLVKCDAGLTVGAKRNVGCAAARGEVIAHFDSDDFSAPHRIEEHLRVMRQTDMPVTGYNSILFLNPARNEAYKLKPGPSSWAAGTSLTYTRRYWQTNNFDAARNVGEDTHFCKMAADQQAIFAIDPGNTIVALDHDDNTSPRGGNGEHHYSEWYYKPVDVQAVRDIIFPARKKVALSLMVWNTKTISLENVAALKDEAVRLNIAGFDTEIIVLDNGSADGFATELRKQKKDLTLILNKKNKGSAVGRNQIIDAAIKAGADYLLFNDGDITAVPWSVVNIVNTMERDANIPCLGAFWDSWTDDPVKATQNWTRKITPMKCDMIAPTQMGVWRKDLFEAIRFDEGFGTGYGWEDDDYFLMMKERGFMPFIFTGMTYLHRHIHHGHHLHANANELYEQRRAYMIAKWKDKPVAAPFMKYFHDAKPPQVA